MTRIRDLSRILQAARNGAELVQGLLTFSRKVEPKPVRLNLNRRIMQVEKLLERIIPKMIDIQLDLSEDLAEINADPVQMEQVLMNWQSTLVMLCPMEDGSLLPQETSRLMTSVVGLRSRPTPGNVCC